MRTVNIVRGSEVAYVKGAPEVVTAMCGLSCDEKAKIQKTVEAWADHGLKVLGGIAVKEDGGFPSSKRILMGRPCRDRRSYP